MKWGKLVNGELQIAPINYVKNDGSVIFNFTCNEPLLKELGYKQIKECETPSYPYIVSYEDTENFIIEHKEKDEDAELLEQQRDMEEQQQKSLSKREVFLAIYDSIGLTPQQIRETVTDERSLIEFDYAERYYKGNPLITILAKQLGYTDEDINMLFDFKMLPKKILTQHMAEIPEDPTIKKEDPMELKPMHEEPTDEIPEGEEPHTDLTIN